MIGVKVDYSDLKNAQKTLNRIRKEMPKAYYAALNRVRQTVRTEAGRQVRRTYQVLQRDVNGQARLETIKAKPGSLMTELRWKGGNLPLAKFSVNPKQVTSRRPKVLKAAVRRTGMKPVKGAFIAKVGRGGHTGVFRRTGRRRLPIQEVFGPAVPVMLNEPGVVKHLEDTALKKMKERLDHEIKRRFGEDGVSIK